MGTLLTPYGRRMAKVLRHRSWVPQQDGSYHPVDVPGPPDFDTWAQCFNVYSTILLMPRYEASLERAEDECRMEHFPRLRLKLGQDLDVFRHAVFRAAADDDKYWDRE
eukprot:3270036-Amphidinium_carterae.1